MHECRSLERQALSLVTNVPARLGPEVVVHRAASAARAHFVTPAPGLQERRDVRRFRSAVPAQIAAIVVPDPGFSA